MYLHVNGSDYYLRMQGDGPPLLLLHGFTGSTRSWGRFADILAAHYRLILVDLIGHGATAAPAEVARYTMPAVVYDLHALCDCLGLAQTAVLGYSMGGRTALHFAAAEPARVSRLLLIGATAGLADPAERAARVHSDEALAARIESDGLAAFVDSWAAQPIFATQTQTLSPAELAAQRRQRLSGSAIGYANSLRGMGSGAQPSLWGRLSTLTMPVTLVAGEHDRKFCTIADNLAAELPDVRVRQIADAGHAAQLERPQSTAAALLAP
jgi:2-succinyl-6-hydroxy-2,4-cyclohexadiene-1-carboxylate synthase